MGKSLRDISVLEHMVSYCEEIIQMVDRFGDSYDAFESDSAYRHACAMCIVQIGELTTRLTDEFRRDYNGMPWHTMKAMRNIAVHNYGSISLENTWDTIKTDIPKLLDYGKTILSHMNEK